MTAVPPSVVYSVSSPSSSSPHILPKHTVTPGTITHPHLDRQADRHLPLERPAERQADRQTERQTELLPHSDRQLERQMHTSSSTSSVAPPSGLAVSIRPCSPPLQIQTPGTVMCIFYNPRLNLQGFIYLFVYFYLSVLQAAHQVHPN